MESVNYNCEIQIQKCESQNSVLNKNPLKKELAPFNHKTFAYSLIGFIFFYCFIWNIEDKTDLAKASTLFTYVNSIINTLCWLFFYFTENTNYLIYGVSSFIISLIAELFYGTRHFPNHMYFLSTYIHHIVFLLFSSICFWNDSLQYTSLSMIVELPTFLLNHKRRYSDNSPWLNYLFGISFLLLRIFYWIWLYFFHPVISNIVLLRYSSTVALFVFIYWFVIWFKKQYRKI